MEVEIATWGGDHFSALHRQRFWFANVALEKGQWRNILRPMAVANLTARGGISQGMNSGSRMYCPNANEMTAIAAGLEETQV